MQAGKISILVFLLVLINPIILWAQDFGAGEPCNNNDPDNNTPCPLDSWVFILMAIALVVTVIHLQRTKQRHMNV
jgi:hypothetical protein